MEMGQSAILLMPVHKFRSLGLHGLNSGQLPNSKHDYTMTSLEVLREKQLGYFKGFRLVFVLVLCGCRLFTQHNCGGHSHARGKIY